MSQSQATKKTKLQRFSTVMIGLAENFNATVSEIGVQMRYEALKDFDIEDIEAAAQSLLLTRKYTNMPTVAELKEHIQGGSIEDKAQVESSKVLTAISERGRYASVVFDDPITQAVIQQHYMGWPAICNQEIKDRRFFLQEFQRAYASFARQDIKQYGLLPGQTHIQNQSIDDPKGKFLPKPEYIGDKKAAEQVHLGGVEKEREAISQEAESQEVTRFLQQLTGGEANSSQSATDKEQNIFSPSPSSEEG